MIRKETIEIINPIADSLERSVELINSPVTLMDKNERAHNHESAMCEMIEIILC